ncbi:MAG: DNA polymerase I [Bacteroidales bacterium]|nr:DNA polymerase I [Bacteroidales bacterium]
MDEKKLFLIDGHAVLYRSYYAFINNPRVNSKGVNTSAIFGFVNTLYEMIRSQKPTHIGVVFDPKGKTFRHQMYDAYKANRQATPEDLKAAIPEVIEIVEAMNIPVIQVEGYEADDVIGTLAKQAARKDFMVYMVTPDKDYAQLVEDKIHMYRLGHAGIDIMGPVQVADKFSVQRPEQIIDLLGLWGDSSDNIPGAPGVGEKTAKSLIAQYDSIEGIYDNIEKLKGKQKENLQKAKDQVLLSKKLATICTEVPISIDDYNFETEQFNEQKLQDKFSELEFFGLAKKMFQTTIETKVQVVKPVEKKQDSFQLDMFAEPVAVQKVEQVASVSGNYRTVTDVESFVKLLSKQLSFSFVICGTSLEPVDSNLVGIAFSWEKENGYYLPFTQNEDNCKSLIEKLAPVFSSCSKKITYDLKYCISVLSRYNVKLGGELHDIMLAHYILQPEARHSLETVVRQFLHREITRVEDVVGKKLGQFSFGELSSDFMRKYMCERADVCLQVVSILENELKELGQYELYMNIECPLTAVLSDMEMTGVRIDSDVLHESSKIMTNQVLDIEKKICELAGHQFNIASPRQLGEVLFDELKIVDKAKKTKSKQYATDAEVLEKLKDSHPIVPLILEYREIKKLLSTYIDSFPLLVNKRTERIHASFNQAVVATGRLSSTNPNLQNIPIRTEMGRQIRKVFIPSVSGNIFLSADYSQIELRLIAHFSEDEHFINAFKNGEDIHRATAAKIYGLPIEEVTSEQRRKAKSANFAISYGTTAFGLSQTLNIPRKEAQELIESYYANYPRVKALMDSYIHSAQEKGYVETMFQRRRYTPDINSQNATIRGVAERNAINAPIQGTAADIIKIAMIHIFERMSAMKLKSKMILQVHDELNFDVFPDELDVMKQIVSEEMQNAVRLKVPLVAEMGVGKNWLEAH